MIRTDMLSAAKDLVKIPSVNGTEGERKVSEFLEHCLRAFPYFRSHPDQIITQELKDDPLHRRNVIAWVKGNGNRTIILHGHMDTVGTGDYGPLEKYAFDPDALSEHMNDVSLRKEVREDLSSGDYMFGRGACDMKSGDAVILGILKDASEHPEDLDGNLLVSFNPVEENLHSGILNAVPLLLKLKEEQRFDYILAINQDYICPLYDGDRVKTIYTGVAGKLLPCFYIRGKVTHVGQCFEGLDASLLASELVRGIHLNTALSDVYNGEVTMPPSVLKCRDLKSWYNVQTAQEAFVYFNYFVHDASIEELTSRLKLAAQQAFYRALERNVRESSRYTHQSHMQVKTFECEPQVITCGELLEEAGRSDAYHAEKAASILQEEQQKGTDAREIPIAIIRYLLACTGRSEPVMVLYYAPPYCPHNTVKDKKLLDEIHTIAEGVEKKSGERYRMMQFFPSLSDSSYLKLDDTDTSIQYLRKNFPGWEKLYPLPLEQIRALSIPAINYGCYGKDAHQWTERVNIPYTFGVLPILIQDTIDFYLKGGSR